MIVISRECAGARRPGMGTVTKHPANRGNCNSAGV